MLGTPKKMPTVLIFRALNIPKNGREHACSVGEDQCLGVAFACSRGPANTIPKHNVSKTLSYVYRE